MHGQSTVASALGNPEKCQATVSGEQFFTRSTASCSRPSNTTSQGLSPSPSSMFPPKKTPKKWTAIHEKYKTTAVIGQGTYGIVYKGERREETKNTQVALKRARLDAFTDFGIPETALREITILTDLKHENIMELIELSCSTQRLYMVCEYLEMDLKKFIRAHNRAVPKQIVKQISYEILKGLAFCHGHRVMHRDLKPHNILLDKEGSRVKLADFGLARPKPAFNKTVTHEVVTLWYRAPELLLGHCKYSDAIDIWSVGCIVAEMLSGRALFPGDSEIDTLLKIFRLLGTPTSEEWPSGAMDPLAHFPVFTCKDDFFGGAVPDIEAEATDFLQKLLAYDPEKRLTATEAMKHSWFDDIRPPFSKNTIGSPASPVVTNGVATQHSSENTETFNSKLLTSVTTTTPRRQGGLPSLYIKACNTLNEALYDDENTNKNCGRGNVNCTATCRDGVAKTDCSKFSFDHQELGVSLPLQKDNITFCRTSPPAQTREEQRQLGQQNNNRDSTVPGTMKVKDLIVPEIDNKAPIVGYLQKQEPQNSHASDGSGVRAVGSSASTVASSSSGVIVPKNRSWWRWNRQGRSKTCVSVEDDTSCRIVTTHCTNDCYQDIPHGKIWCEGGQGGDGVVMRNSSIGNTRSICVNNRVTKSTTSSSVSTSFSEPLCAPIDTVTVTASTSSASALKDEIEDFETVHEFDTNPGETFMIPHNRQPIAMDKVGMAATAIQKVSLARASSVGSRRVGIESFGNENVQSNNFGARGNCCLLANAANVSFVRRSNVELGGERGRENSVTDKLLLHNGRIRPNSREFETRCDDGGDRFHQNSSFAMNMTGHPTSSYTGCNSEHLLLRGDEHVTFTGGSFDGDKSGGSSSNFRSKGTCFPAKRRFRRYNPLRCLAGTVLEEGGTRCHTSSATSACTRGHSKEHEEYDLGVGNSAIVAGGSCCSSSSGSITCSSSNSCGSSITVNGGSSGCDSKGWTSGFSLKGRSRGLFMGGSVGVDSGGCCTVNNGESGSEQMTEPSVSGSACRSSSASTFSQSFVFDAYCNCGQLPRAGEMKRRSLPNVALISSAIKNCTSKPFCAANAGIGVKVDGISCLTRTACQRLCDMSPATAMYANSSIAHL